MGGLFLSTCLPYYQPENIVYGSQSHHSVYLLGNTFLVINNIVRTEHAIKPFYIPETLTLGAVQ